MTTHHSTAISLAVLLAVLPAHHVVAWASGGDQEAMLDSVSGDSMMDTIEALQAFGTREWHTENAALAGEYVFDRFDTLGVDVDKQEFEHDGLSLFNVVAVVPGTDPSLPFFLFGAHYDSENFAATTLSQAENYSAPGADDDASGVSALIELARIVSQAELRNGVKLVAFAAEEYGYDNSGGLVGSSVFVAAEKAAGVEYEGTAILDMIGYASTDQSKAVIVLEEEADPLAAETTRAVGRFGLELSLEVIVAPEVTYSDHEPFWSAGYPSMLVIEELEGIRAFPVNPYYHTADDLAEHLSQDQLTEVVKALLGGLLELTHGEDGIPIIYLVVILAAAAAAAATVLVIRLRRNGARKP